LRHEAGGLELLDKFAQEGDAFRLPALRGADRLRYLHETALDEPASGVRRDELGHRLPDAGGRLKVLGEEHRGALVTADHRGVPQRARQEEVVRGALLHADADARLVDLARRAQRRLVRHRVHALDQHVRRGERDLRGAGGLDGEEADVRLAGGSGGEGVAGTGEAAELDGDAEPGGDLEPDVNGDARRRGRRPLDEHRVVQVERGPQHAGRCEIGDDARRDIKHAITLR
jgi:hypothetical protein